MTGHPALAAVAAVLHRHTPSLDGVCRCGWGSDGYPIHEGELQLHHEHVAEQLAIAGVIKAGDPA